MGMERGTAASPNNAVKVRVHEITSVTDPDTGKPGKNIKLVQVRQQRPQQQTFLGPFGSPQDQNMIRDIMSQFQSLGIVPFGGMSAPKINLFLSESEYDLLGVRFEVNEIYDMILKDGTIRFQKPMEGV
jgi:hypothetical protein